MRTRATRAELARRIASTPDARKPWLLLARLARGSVVVTDGFEARGDHSRGPAFEAPVGAVALTVPPFFVVAARVRREEDAARLEGGADLAENPHAVAQL